jgi:hypothetical protein
MDTQWHYCTLEEYAQGDSVQARAVFHGDPVGETIVNEYNYAGEGLFRLGKAGWELVNVIREARPGAEPTEPSLVITTYHLKQVGGAEVWQHCLMTSVDAGEEVESSAVIHYLDSLDADGNPRWEESGSQGAGFKKLGAEGWKLIQVVEGPRGEGVYDGPTGLATRYYFARPVPGKG